MLKQYKLRFYNFRLIIFLLAISLIGVTLVGTAASDLRSKQFAGVILGLIVMLILSLLDYSWIMNFQWIMYGFFMDHEETLNTLKTLALSGVLLAVPLFLILEQPDLKNTITVVVIFCIMIYIAGLSYKIIGGALLIAVPLTIIFLSIVVQPDQKLLKDYQRSRIMSFLYPENEEYSDDIEQQNNSKTAIASGELVGKKLSGDNSTTSVNQGNFVAENQTDFIFAVAGEEYGFIGCVIIVLLLLAIAFECIRMSLRAKDLSGKVLCCGIGGLIALQSFINICVATGLAPNTGTPLPFVSYGLTSLVSLYIGMGLVLNVGLQSSTYNKEIIQKEIDRREDYL